MSSKSGRDSAQGHYLHTTLTDNFNMLASVDCQYSQLFYTKVQGFFQKRKEMAKNATHDWLTESCHAKTWPTQSLKPPLVMSGILRPLEGKSQTM